MDDSKIPLIIIYFYDFWGFFKSLFWILCDSIIEINCCMRKPDFHYLIKIMKWKIREMSFTRCSQQGMKRRKF